MSENNSRQCFGRRKIYTSVIPTVDTIPTIINDALKLHYQNKEEIAYLINYYLGKQPILQREKEVNADINNKIVVNHAYESVRNITGYFMGTPVQYTLKSTEKQESLQVLNDAMSYENRALVDTEVEDYASICGIGYKCTLFDAKVKNDIPYTISSLPPTTTFCVYSTDIGNDMVLSVNYFSYRDVNDNPMRRYVCYTDTDTFVYITQEGADVQVGNLVQRQKHFLGANPIVPYENNQWLLGDFETALTILDAINTLSSNTLDDVEQVVQAILVLFGIPEESHESLTDLRSGDALVFSGEQGINQDAKYITASLDANNVEGLREYLEESYKSVVGIPDRKTRGGGGGDTGDAVKLRDGWADLELVARKKEMYWRAAEMQSLNLALNILHSKNIVPDLNSIDVDIKFSRNKNDNLQSKVQAGATLYSMGVGKIDVASAMDITTDNTEFVKRWEEAEEVKRNIAAEMVQQNNPDELTQEDNDNN
jgi:SPP1 family phage portal protein